MATEAIGLPFDLGAYGAWLIWILPFVAALIIPAVGKGSKRATGYVAVAFALMSALSAASLLPAALEAHEIHDQISWISSIGLNAGVLADPLAGTISCIEPIKNIIQNQNRTMSLSPFM